MAEEQHRVGAAARIWFAVTPPERKLLFGILAVALLGFTARYIHLRAQRPAALDASDGIPAHVLEEPAP